MNAYGGGVDSYRAHMTAIRRIVDAWQRGEITAVAKRQAIAELNAAYYGEPTRGKGSGKITDVPRVLDDVIYVIADGHSVPIEAAAAALAARRRGSVRSSLAETLEEARRESRDGVDGYGAILKAAR